MASGMVWKPDDHSWNISRHVRVMPPTCSMMTACMYLMCLQVWSAEHHVVQQIQFSNLIVLQDYVTAHLHHPQPLVGSHTMVMIMGYKQMLPKIKLAFSFPGDGSILASMPLHSSIGHSAGSPTWESTNRYSAATASMWVPHQVIWGNLVNFLVLNCSQHTSQCAGTALPLHDLPIRFTHSANLLMTQQT